MNEIRAQVGVVGAGAAGLYAATLLARRGVDVVLVERRARGESGPRWMNDVPWWMLREAGLDGLDAAMLGASDCPFLLYAPGGVRPCVRVEEIGLVEVDMMRLVGWLSDAFEEAGGRALWGTSVGRADIDHQGRVSGLWLDDSQGQTTHLSVDVVIDAAGMSGVVRSQSPWLQRWCPPVQRGELCTAVQEVRWIDDIEGAEAFLDRHGGRRGEFLSWVGVAGGYSVLRILVWENEDKVSILTGAQSSYGSSGKAVLSSFLRGEGSWCGERWLGGGRAIPLRRVYGMLVAPGVALLGDAACQVFAAHGSGIGVGLNAARVLSDVIVEALEEGEDVGSVRALWEYPARFMMRWGAVLGYADWTRRWTASMPPERMRALLESGLMTPGLVEDGLLQTLPNLHPAEWLGQVQAALSNPSYILYMLPLLARLPSLGVHSLGFPRKPDLRAVTRYEARLDELARGLG